MSLSSAMNTAQSIFNNTGKQTQTVSKNMANVGNADYARRSSITTTSLYGAQIITTARAQNDMLLRQVLSSTSQSAGQDALLQGLKDIKSVLGGNDNESAPSTYLAQFQNALHDYAVKPNDQILGMSVINAARDVATSLNSATEKVQSVRADADVQIAAQVEKLNNLLKLFQEANEAVTTVTAVGRDPNDALDVREGLLKQISSIVGVSTMAVENNGLALYTTGGIALFDKTPRNIEFVPRSSYDPTVVAGNPIKIDGINLPAGKEANTTAMGSLQALLQVRDEIAPTFQGQLLEFANVLTGIFAQSGLFGLVVPPSSKEIIRVTTSDPLDLRDGTGGTLNPSYPSRDAGFSGLLDQYETALDEKHSFSLGSSSIMDFSARSVGWLETWRSGADAANENKAALLARSSEAYSNVTGVSLDEEMSLMLDIEQSYKAAAKLLAAVDEMLKTLLALGN